MAIRILNQHIPGGFTHENASKLGEAFRTVDETENEYLLVSYLTSPLKKRNDNFGENLLDSKDYIRNTYVVFANTTAAIPVPEPQVYRWNIEFYHDDNVYDLKPEIFTENGEFRLDTSHADYIELQGLAITCVKIQVEIDGVSIFDVEQSVEGIVASIEELFTGEENLRLAKGGNPYVSRYLANDYGQYFSDIKGANETTIPINMLASAVYITALNTNYYAYKFHEGEWLKPLDSSMSSIPLGLLNIMPHVALMILSKLTGPVADRNAVFHTEDETQEQYYNRVFEWFAAPERENECIDIINRLRFPKSSFLLAMELLSLLINEHSDWGDLTKDQVKEEREVVEILISFLELGPYAEDIKPTKIGGAVFSKMFTPYMEAIVAEEDVIPYEIISTKVLDIRSGKPIKDARVRKLIIKSNDHVIGMEQEFTFDSNKLTGNTLNKRSQFALLYLGYDPNGPSNNYGNTGRQRFNEYWDDRVNIVIDDTVEDVNAGNPPPELLELIVKEFNSHRATDNNGNLNIRVPQILFRQRTLSIYVTFWDFSITLEELAGNSASNPVSRPDPAVSIPVENSTDFRIEWMDDESLQEAEWNSYFNVNNYLPDPHFGWKVIKDTKESLMKACYQLIVKNNTDEFNGFNDDLLSKYYDRINYPFHFVLFGMQWCQPVWGEFSDPVIPNSHTNEHVYITENVYCNDSEYVLLTVDGYTDNASHTSINRRMHIVSNVNMSTLEPLRQKGYGVYDIRPNPARGIGDRHRGYDLYNEEGLPVFAIHGASAKGHATGAGWGENTRLTWAGEEVINAHFRAVNPRPNKIPNYPGSVRVLAGEVIGYSGRTELGNSNPQHTHIRFRHNGNEITLNNPISGNNPNKLVLPHNELPLVFPCRSRYVSRDPGPCEFSTTVLVRNNKKAIEKCFAPMELCCPYMNVVRTDVKAPQKLQAQLKFIFIRRLNAMYRDPGPIDGILGAIPSEPNTVSQNIKVKQTRYSIRAFREVNNYSSAFSDAYILEGNARSILDNIVTSVDAFQYLTNNGLFNEDPFPLDNDNKCLQAQLKSISHMNIDARYRDPGAIDGALGAIPHEPDTTMRAIRVGPTRYAIRAFREVNNLTVLFVDDYAIPATAGSAEWNLLDGFAPIIVQ